MAKNRSVTGILALGLLAAATAHYSTAMAPPSRSTPKPYASRNVSFTAKRAASVWLNGKTEAAVYREYHASSGMCRFEYLAPASARGRVLIQKHGTVWQYEPSQKKIFVTSAHVADNNEDTIQPLLSKNYQILPMSNSKSEAGRSCRVLKLIPRHSGKSRWLISVDRDTGIILKRERYGPKGELELVSQFLEFKPGKVDPGLFDAGRLPKCQVVNRTWSEKPVSPGKMKECLGITPPLELKGGFRLSSSVMVGGDHGTAQLTYTDGLVAVSVFGSKSSKSSPSRGHHVKLGKTDAVVSSYGHLASITWRAGSYSYTIVGNVSESVLLDMARALAAH